MRKADSPKDEAVRPRYMLVFIFSFQIEVQRTIPFLFRFPGDLNFQRSPWLVFLRLFLHPAYPTPPFTIHGRIPQTGGVVKSDYCQEKS